MEYLKTFWQGGAGNNNVLGFSEFQNKYEIQKSNTERKERADQ